MTFTHLSVGAMRLGGLTTFSPKPRWKMEKSAISSSVALWPRHPCARWTTRNSSFEASRLWLPPAKRLTLDEFQYAKRNTVIERNQRVGFGITGCLASPLFDPTSLARANIAKQQEDKQ